MKAKNSLNITSLPLKLSRASSRRGVSSSFSTAYSTPYASILANLSSPCQEIVMILSRVWLKRSRDKALTFPRRADDTSSQGSREAESMLILRAARQRLAIRATAAVLALCFAPIAARAQEVKSRDIPLISGGVGFVTSTNGGNTTYLPVISPLLAAPVGSSHPGREPRHCSDSFFPKVEGEAGYKSDTFLGLTFLQADILASRHVTIVAGEFLTPFATYNERLTPIWIGNFEDAPLIFSLGTMGTASSVGGMLRGSAFSTSRLSADYAVYFSANSTNQQFNARRASGGRGSLYFPAARLEAGASYGRLLQGAAVNFAGAHLWWEPSSTALKLRSEYAHGPHSRGTGSRLIIAFPDSRTGRVSPAASSPCCACSRPFVPARCERWASVRRHAAGRLRSRLPIAS